MLLPDYLDTMLTNDECLKCVDLMRRNNQATVKEYPESAFLLDHEGSIYRHIPEQVLQENISENYKRYIEKHASPSEQACNLISMQLFGEAIPNLGLAKLIPVLKLLTRIEYRAEYVQILLSSANCHKCEAEEDLRHVFFMQHQPRLPGQR